MKIKSLEFENFRNYKAYNKINFSTDGKVDIIYGANGAGKTTFQQLIKWVLYGRIRFNKTTNDYLYNLEVAHKAKINDKFRVLGSIDFIHKGVNYTAKREFFYEKTIFGIKEISSSFTVSYENENKVWDRINDPVGLIEKLLPSGLESYFFLEGENMIADLKVKGKESAGNLKDALYLMLDLAVYDRAIKIIGKDDLKTTVLGSLYMDKTSSSSNSEIQEYGNKLVSAQNARDTLDVELNKLNEKISFLEDEIKDISEQIGAAKSQEEYEKRRKECKSHKENYVKEVNAKYIDFGEFFANIFPKVVISNITDKASKNIKDAAESQFVHGINRPLIDTLLKRDTCICGNKLTEREKDVLRGYYKMLPPDGYDDLYHDFVSTAKEWNKEYDKNKIEEIIKSAIRYLDFISAEEETIQSIENEMKQYKGIDDLVVKRKQDEVKIESLTDKRDELNSNKQKTELYIKKLKKNINEKTAELDENKNIEHKLQIMSEVQKEFEEFLVDKSNIYSKKLEEAIQELVDYMLIAKRKVSVTKDFALQVVDSYDDESKSDGQLATISFAYIGGIFKVLKDNKIIDNTEYPLIMDAPFSKLNKESIEKVVEIIPQYAPQMIILIKDDVLNYFDESEIGRIYTIQSNDEQNISEIKEGKLWQ